jgi:hypothetical protein
MQDEITLTIKIHSDQLVRLLRVLLGDMSLNSNEAVDLLTDAQLVLQMAECREFICPALRQKADTTLDVAGLVQLRPLIPGTLAVPSSDLVAVATAPQGELP